MKTASDAQRVRLDSAKINHATYKIILSQIQKKIGDYASMRHTDLLVKIPDYVPGRPVFKPERATRYVRDKLRIAGFEVEQRGVQFLDVSWKTAKPSTPRPKKKKEKTREVRSPVTSEEIANRLGKLQQKLAGVL